MQLLVACSNHDVFVAHRRRGEKWEILIFIGPGDFAPADVEAGYFIAVMTQVSSCIPHRRRAGHVRTHINFSKKLAIRSAQRLYLRITTAKDYFVGGHCGRAVDKTLGLVAPEKTARSRV